MSPRTTDTFGCGWSPPALPGRNEASRRDYPYPLSPKPDGCFHLGVDTAAVRAEIYRSFVEDARPPRKPEIADRLGLDVAAVDVAYAALAREHVIALRPDSDELWLAHPFCRGARAFPSHDQRSNVGHDMRLGRTRHPRDSRFGRDHRDNVSRLRRIAGPRSHRGRARRTGWIHRALRRSPRSWYDDIGFT